MTFWVLAFVLVNVFLDLGPGRAVERSVAEGMTHGWIGAQAAILGVLAADVVWCFLAVSALFTAMVMLPPLLYWAKWIGLGLLLVLIARSLRIAVMGRGVHPVEPARPTSGWQAFRSAFVLQTGHPTPLIFFLAVLSVFAGSRIGWETRMLDFGLLAVALEWPVLTAYAFIGAASARPGAKSLGVTAAALSLLVATGLVAMPSPPPSLRQR
ncbi:MAG: LysE family transporter [Hyphomicrobiales bacterium]|nr:LysE family transporter [Hyphomicrobiales bacterium]